MDHPRSRGVYSDRWRGRRASRGSSPLARGLLGSRVESTNTSGIIPARAGFTPVGVGAPAGPGDHPRSRGVYPAQGGGAHQCPGRGGGAAGFTPHRAGAPRERKGSSPLARGLRGPLEDLPGLGGIIPARAGFTTPPGRGAAPGPDHPRSRGVYLRRRLVGAGRVGSSPLARGLQTLVFKRVAKTGIIPARAGFTP